MQWCLRNASKELSFEDVVRGLFTLVSRVGSAIVGRLDRSAGPSRLSRVGSDGTVSPSASRTTLNLGAHLS